MGSLTDSRYRIPTKNIIRIQIHYGQIWITFFLASSAWTLSWGYNLPFTSSRTLVSGWSALAFCKLSCLPPIRVAAKCLHIAKSAVLILSTSYSIFSAPLETTDHCPSPVLVSTAPHSLDFSPAIFLSCVGSLCSLPLLHWSLSTGDSQGSEISPSSHLLSRCYYHFHSFKPHLKVNDSHTCISTYISWPPYSHMKWFTSHLTLHAFTTYIRPTPAPHAFPTSIRAAIIHSVVQVKLDFLLNYNNPSLQVLLILSPKSLSNLLIFHPTPSSQLALFHL